MVRPAVAAVVTGLDEGQSLGPLGPAAVAAGLPVLQWDTEKPAPSTQLVTAKWHLISGSLFPESGRLLSGLAPPPITCIECGRLPSCPPSQAAREPESPLHLAQRRAGRLLSGRLAWDGMSPPGSRGGDDIRMAHGDALPLLT